MIPPPHFFFGCSSSPPPWLWIYVRMNHSGKVAGAYMGGGGGRVLGVQTPFGSFVYLYISFIHSFIHSFIYWSESFPLAPLFIHSFIHSFNHSFIYLSESLVMYEDTPILCMENWHNFFEEEKKVSESPPPLPPSPKPPFPTKWFRVSTASQPALYPISNHPRWKTPLYAPEWLIILVGHRS